jgi:uncharacterized protein (DUF433 family)
MSWTDRPLTQYATWLMIRRRAAAAGITALIGNHIFRATGITAYLAKWRRARARKGEELFDLRVQGFLAMTSYILCMEKISWPTRVETHDTLFTTTEAAVLTGLTLKAVNNAIDRNTVSAVPGKEGGRLLDARALVSLSIERRLSDRIAPELRRKLFDALAEAARDVVSLEGGLIKIDLRQPRREIAASMRDLRRARRLVVTDPEILGGDPVFRGTRVPVHVIAELVAQGGKPAELLESYPRLTAEMIRLAPIYAAAYPLRGARRKLPWRYQQPVRRGRRKLDAIAV